HDAGVMIAPDFLLAFLQRPHLQITPASAYLYRQGREFWMSHVTLRRLEAQDDNARHTAIDPLQR
ncbi:MAG TPA: hypothetical protein VF387_07450, partial [Gemmatimonadaceae bacterium]